MIGAYSGIILLTISNTNASKNDASLSDLSVNGTNFNASLLDNSDLLSSPGMNA